MAETSPKPSARPPASGSQSLMWRWIGVALTLCAVGVGLSIFIFMNSSRAWGLVAILTTAAVTLAAFRYACKEKSRMDKYLEYGLMALVSALMINIVTNLVWEGWVNTEPPKSDQLYRNHDLARLSGTVIKAILEQTVADAERGAAPPLQDDQRDGLLRLAGGVLDDAERRLDQDRRLKWEQWLESAQAEVEVAGAGIGQDALVAFVRDPHTKALTITTWEKWLAKGASACEMEFETEGSVAALRLHSEFGTVMRETLKHDYAAGGDASKAFAAMQLDIMRELLDDSPRLTLYHLNGSRTSEITHEYTGVRQDDHMRVKADGVDGKHWYILTIDGAGNVALFAPDQLSRDDDGLWAWEPTAPPTETVLLLDCSHELSVSEQRNVEAGIRGLQIKPTLETGAQIVWGDAAGDDRGWRLVKGGRGQPGHVDRSGDTAWMTLVCDELRKINGLRFEGRTIVVTPAPVPADAKGPSHAAPHAQG